MRTRSRSTPQADPDRKDLRRRLALASQRRREETRLRRCGAFDSAEGRALRDRIQAAKIKNLRARLWEVVR